MFSDQPCVASFSGGAQPPEGGSALGRGDRGSGLPGCRLGFLTHSPAMTVGQVGATTYVFPSLQLPFASCESPRVAGSPAHAVGKATRTPQSPSGSSVSPALATTGPRKQVLAQSGHQLGGLPYQGLPGFAVLPGGNRRLAPTLWDNQRYFPTGDAQTQPL